MLWPFAIYGMIRAARNRTPAWGAFFAWIIGGFVLAYLPVYIQRRFLLGITMPLGALALFGLIEIFNALPSLAPVFRKGALYAYIVFASMTSIYLVFGASLYMQSRPKDSFYPKDLDLALKWLDQNALPNDVALGDGETSQLLPQLTRLKVYSAHDMETLFFKEKKIAVEAYYNNAAPDNWLKGTNVKWVIFGPFEQTAFPDFKPDDSLELVYENATVKIYQVLR